MFLDLPLPQFVAIAIIPLLFAITLHEVAHGYVAYKLGDSTARMLGRLSLNPLKHIDLFGTVLLPALLLMTGGFIFGWAKPVPVNYRNLKNIRQSMILVALAGPFANLLMALFWALVAKLMLHTPVSDATEFFGYMSLFGIFINLMLMALNLLPIPPLDGSRVVSSLLPPRYNQYYSRLEPYGFIILIALIVLNILPLLMMPIMNTSLLIIVNLFGLSLG